MDKTLKARQSLAFKVLLGFNLAQSTVIFMKNLNT